ncbi:Hypothetical protein CINCED_3A003660 [Cinara cedri]|uniref:FAT domain-containing protein n=1 Tax=Cinara cedri TaxID=506608 RepID=A0A5E4MZA1_9HEMI|nr:Hypothetical protein CINCED_3A003660 [Cinara cedri]
MVMNVLSYVIKKQNQLITNINTFAKNKNPILDLFYRVLQIFIRKLKQFQIFYLPQLDWSSLSQDEGKENMMSIIKEYQSDRNQEFMYGYHSSQIQVYTVYDSKRFIKIVIPAIRTIFQFIVKIEGTRFTIELFFNKLLNKFLKHSLLSLKLCNCPNQKKDMVKEILTALSCVNPIHLKICITTKYDIIKLIYAESLETLIFDMALNDEVLVLTFSSLMFEFILNNLVNEIEQKCIVDLVHRLQLNFKLSTSDEIANEYIYKIIKTLMNNLQNTNHVMFNIEVLKTIFAIVESAHYELGENMNSLLKHLFTDLLSYQISLPNSLGLTKIALSELCLAECMLKVVPPTQIIDLFPIIAYSLQIEKLISQGLFILKKCVAILPGNFFNDLDLNIRNEILMGLYYCLNNPSESISQPVVSLLGKFGGLNRSLLKPYQLDLKTKYHQNEKKPKILISFEHFEHNLIELDIEPSINTAVEILMSNFDRFNRVHSWNVIKGFLVVSLDCDTSGITNILSNVNWETFIDIFENNYTHNVKTSIDETYIKALTGLMICCNDEYLKTDALQYFNEFTKLIVHISICHFSSILYGRSSNINPYTLIDAIIIVLSHEKEIISSFGALATELVMKELNIILGCNMVYFPLITYMIRQCCELCYDTNWIHKRGGCFGLQILFSILLKEDTITETFSNWFIQHFLSIFKAMVFIFSDLNEQLTFGALEIAKNNLDVMINWLYWTNPNKSSHNLIKETILKDIADNIIGPNDLLRELSIRMVTCIAEKQQKLVSDILIPYHEHFNLAIPGYRLFNTYTYKSQMGIMKGHIFCMLFSIPLIELDFSKKEHEYYFNFLCMICRKNDKQIKKIHMFMGHTSKELYEYRKTVIQVLVNCISFFKYNEKKVLKLFLNMLINSDDQKLQEMVYQCLKLHTHRTILMEMVDKLLIHYNKLYGNNSKITLVNTRRIMYLSKLFPSRPSIILSSILLKSFKYFWNKKYNCKNKQSNCELENTLKNILEIMSLIKATQFFQVQEICEIILNADILLYRDLCNQLHPLLIKCLSKFPEDCVKMFFKDINIKNSIWTSFFNSMIRNENDESLRIKLKTSPSLLENLLLLSKIDPSRTIQYECIKMIYNMAKMDKQWIIETKLINTLLNIWSDIQYKDRYKNLAAIKLTEWDEPKMLLKIILIYFKSNVDQIFILFQLLPAFTSRFPIDINFFRKFVENEMISSYSVKWIRKIVFKFIDLYHNKGANSDLLGRTLQYLILPSLSMCYKKGENEKLCKFTNPDENILGIILNKIFGNIRTALTGCDFDGIKLFLCQLLCLLFHDLISYNENISRVIHNGILSCKTAKCSMDLNVKYHCNLILIFLMLSGKTPKNEKQYQVIYDELLKCSSPEALPVIQYSLSFIVTAALENSVEVNTLIACVKNSIMSESHNFHTLHHILFFVKKYNTLFYPYKEDMSPLILKSLLPVAKNNNMADYKKTAMELACLIVEWDLGNPNMDVACSLKTNEEQLECNNSSSQLKKSSAYIEDALNFLAKVACQTYDDKHDSKISRLAKHSDIFFKNILSTKTLDTKDVKLKLKWIEKVLETFLKKENLSKQNPNVNGNTNSNVLSLVAIFEMISFLLKVLSQQFMLEVISSLQDYLIQFLQLVFNDVLSNNQNPHNPKETLANRLSVSQVKQCNEGTLKVITDILKAFPSIDGLEKLHTSIQTIISEGLNSNSLHKLDVSLTLLNASLLYFSNYLDNEIVNTIGDILFKFNTNNSNPSIKVKSLDILKTHVDTLSRNGKQVFIEKVVLENLNKARDSENNIPFEVQIKCFELIITYIKDIPEATEGIILNSTILEYIKTTTDERIMTIILNVITKWIEICRDESVLFNCQIINILKSITIINRFPRLSDYCYTLNLEIFKNWFFRECIEFGLNCKSSPIRYDFLHFLDTLWIDGGLCMRLSSIMSDEFNYDLENALAFYIQLLFVKITRNTKLQGDFPILRKLAITNETLVCSENNNFLELYPVNGVHTFDVCSSLAQLCFVNVNLAKIIWTSVLPSVWNMFNDEQKKLLTQKAVNFLVNSKLNKNSMAAFYEAIILCLPKIKFEPHQMVYIGKTYSLWYKVIEQLEEICDYFQHEKKNEAVEGLIQMYSLLHEEDILESLFQKTIKCEETKIALSLEQLGCYKRASTIYMELLNRKINELEDNHTNIFNKEIEFRKIHLTKCLRELNDWNYLSEHLLENNCVLNIEYTWKKSIGKTSNINLRWDLEHKQQIWPSKSIWKYHFYLAMLGLNELDQQGMSIVQEHIVLAIKEIVDKWKALPKYLCNAHIPLLQATQLIVEIQEAHDYQKSLLQSPKNINNICSINDNWNNRKPWIGDNLNFWNDLISWRKTYYSFLISRNLNTKILNIKSAVDQSNLMFGKIALKHNMTDVCLNTLQTLDSDNVNTSNWLYKMFLEAKCIQKFKKYKKYNYLPKTCFLLNKDFKDDMKPLLFIIKGIFYDYGGSRDTAFSYFANGFFNGTSTRKPNDVIEWEYVIHNYNTYSSSIYKRSDDNYVTTLNNTEILEHAWIQWATLIENYLNQSTAKDIKIVLAAMKCYIIASELANNKNNNILIAKILLLLTYDDKNCTLLHVLENCNITYSDLWLPQILNIFVEKTETVIEKIILKIRKLHPQKMYLILYRMYLIEQINQTKKMEPPFNYNKYGVQNDNYKVKKIKRMMNLLQKYNFDTIQLDYFINEVGFLE